MVTYRDLQSPDLASQFAVELYGHLRGYTHQHVLFTQGSSQNDLTGHWKYNHQKTYCKISTDARKAPKFSMDEVIRASGSCESKQIRAKQELEPLTTEV